MSEPGPVWPGRAATIVVGAAMYRGAAPGYKCLVVTCPRCGASRGDGDRFCGACGAPLGGCPSCGQPVLPGDRFCPSCGHALAVVAAGPLAAVGSSAVAGPPAERRVCSVLFCDVVGFTPLSEARDPEAVRELLSQYLSLIHI